MTQDFSPITPPPELVEQWRDLPECTNGRRKMIMVTISREKLQDIATQAARWGADIELEACKEWVSWRHSRHESDELLFARRPKPPSLKEQALQALDLLKVDASTHGLGFDSSAIRRALESLPD